MLDRAQLDGVMIATPGELHCENVIDTISRALPTFVEKPVATSVEEASQMKSAAARAGVPVLVGHHRRHNPIIQKAREIVASGKLGDVTAVSARVLCRKADDYYNVPWRVQAGSGGFVLNSLIHDVDSIRYIVGDIVGVQAIVTARRRKLQIEDTAVVMMDFANGAVGTTTASDITPSPANWEVTSGENPAFPLSGSDCYLIAGTEGSLEIPSLRLWLQDEPKTRSRPLQVEISSIVKADPLVVQLQHFMSVISGESAPVVSISDAAGSLAVISAIHTAARLGGSVTPDIR
jgi:predicted dehydrogenase